MSFEFSWNWAWDNVFGDNSEGVPWCQITLRTDSGDPASQVLWTSRYSRLLNKNIPSNERANSAWMERQECKGIQRTAEMLWEVRGDKTKEGLVLCHALLHSLGGSSRSPRNSALLELTHGLEKIPPLPVHWPWHHWSSDTLPRTVSSLCDDLLYQ